jgi:SOS response regulatory protein OraA/RecX
MNPSTRPWGIALDYLSDIGMNGSNTGMEQVMASKRTSSLVITLIVAAVALFLCGCDAKSAAAQRGLTKEVEKEGVSFMISPDWKDTLDEEYGHIEPSDNNVITVTTFADGETQDFKRAAQIAGILGDYTAYQAENPFDIDGGTSITCYSDIEDDHAFSAAVGYNKSTNAGFIVFFNRGDKSNMGKLDDDTYKAILKTISFDPSKVPNPTPTESQTAALAKAEDYLTKGNFSYSALYNLVKTAGYSSDDALYAVNHCNADWYQQALEKAEEYIEYGSYSHDGLVKQLVQNGYLYDQATYAADNCGADWTEQAEKEAELSIKYGTTKQDELIDYLEKMGFTEDQARLGVQSALRK